MRHPQDMSVRLADEMKRKKKLLRSTELANGLH